ncbi:TPA: YPDG domain-containing protein, partial [Streptococcus suis]
MSNRDKNMFRQEQRFSFRKYSFGLASALIANVVFGATIAGGPVVHANTETEAATVTSTSSVQSETVGSTEPSVAEETVATPVVRNVSLTYTVKVVDKEGAVLRTEVKTVDVTTGEEVASVLAELGEDLVPTDYKLIAGLGQVHVLENQDNVFTVTVEKIVTEQTSESSTANASETATSSETSVASSEAPVEVIASSETSVAPAIVKVTESVATNTSSLSSLALLAYEVHYTDTEGQVVGKTAGLVTAESKDSVATKQVNFTATDVPAGYELAPGQSQVLTKQLVENQINILSFAVVKKSEEEEIAESQLAHKDVLEQVTSEADLLADEALRQVATSQAGNTALETAATATKEVVAEAQGVLKDASATQETVDAQVETVKASTKALADEMLKVDEDGVLTAQLSISTSGDTNNVSYIGSNLAGTAERVRLVSSTVRGKTITYVVEYNIHNGSGYGAATHTFGLPKGVIESSVNIVREQRSDSTSAWTADGTFTASDYPTYPGSTSNRTKFTDAAGNLGGGIYDFREAATVSGTPSTDIQNMYNGTTIGSYYESQMAITTRAYRYTITATLADGYDAPSSDFVAGFIPGTGRDRWYTAVTRVAPDAPVAEKTDQYSITWDNQSVAGRSDAGFEWAQDANGNRVLVYKYNLDNHTAFTVDDVLKQLNATGAGLRTLDGTEKALIENTDASDGYTTEGNTAKLNGQTIDFLDVVNPNPLWGGRQVVGPASPANTNANYTTLYVPGTTNIGTATNSITLGGTNGVASFTHTDNARNLYTNQINRQKLYIRSTPANVEAGSGSAVAQDTDTDTIPVYLVGYKDVPRNPPTVTINSTPTNVQINDGSVPNAIFVFGTNQGTTEDINGATGTSPVADPTKATQKVAEITDDGTISSIVYHDTKNTRFDLASATDPSTSNPNDALLVNNEGYLTGHLIYGPGAKSTRRLDVTDNTGATTNSDTFLVLGYTDKVSDTTAVGLEYGVRPTLADITAKMAIDVNSSYPNAVSSALVVPATQYTREVVGYRMVGSTDVTAVTSAEQLPVTGDYDVKVKTKNIYGQEIFNWVRVDHTDNTPPSVTINSTPTNVQINDGSVPKAIFVFGTNQGSTEDINGATGTSPVADPTKATRKVAEISDADNDAINSIVYHDTKNTRFDLASATDPSTSNPNDALLVNNEGYLTGHLVYGPGAKSTRRLDVTDSRTATTNSDTFMVLGYTDKVSDATPVAKDIGQRPTETEVFSKLAIDVNSSYPNAVPSGLVIPEDQYTREIVGYRAVTTSGTTETKGLTVQATADQLPTAGDYEVRVKTTNIYGQEIYNWVRVEYPDNIAPTVSQTIPNQYVWKGTPLSPAIDADVNDVNSTPTRDDIREVYFSYTQNTDNAGNPGAVSIVKDENGNYLMSGTPVGEAGYTWNRKITAVDKQNATGQSNAFNINILDSNVISEITKPENSPVTAEEVLAKVEVLSRTVEPTKTHDITSQLATDGGVTKRILTDLAALPKTGRQTVQVELTTPSGHTKIEEVIVNFTPPVTNALTPAYAENTVAPGASATTPPTFTNADGQPATAPTGATYAIPASFTPPTGYTATIDPTTGAVTLTAPTGATVETVEVPVTVTYADGSTDATSAVFKLDTDGDGTPNVTDTDDDNDGIPDTQDKNSLTPTTSAVTVNDATVVAGQPIPAIPVTVTTDDTQATVEVTNLPAGLTYNPTTKQIEGTPTGAEIPEGQDSTTVTVTATVTDATGTPVSDTAVITIQRDTDGDGIPDVTDTDDDNDGIPDTQDSNPKTAATSTVTVDDATVVAGQPIPAIPVTVTTDDTQATVAVTDLPAGLTYNPTTKQIEGTPTGAEIPEGQDSTTVTVTATVTDATGTPVSDTAVITIQRDTDGDGQPDVTDTDDDNDGIPDTQDNNPKTATTSAVTVNDATVVAGQPIKAIPVAVTTDDTQATVEVTNLPAGLTYNKATGQITGTPTGAEIPAGQDETT